MSISVCIPVRDGASTIAETIRSVLAQDVDGVSLEVVVSDNRSTDGTEDVVRPFLADPRVRYHRSDRDLELFASFKRAVELGSGDAFVALGADDVLLPGFLAHLEARLRGDGRNAVALAGCAARVIDAEGHRLPLRLRPRPLGRVPGRKLRARMLLTGLNLIGSPSTVLIRRSAYDAAGGFRPGAGYAGDLDLWLRLAEVGDADLSDDELVLYRVHAGSFTSSRARGQVASVLAALQAAEDRDRRRPFRISARSVLVRVAWVGRRIAVRRALRA